MKKITALTICSSEISIKKRGYEELFHEKDNRSSFFRTLSALYCHANELNIT
jgi:predicted CopG family antitoxin